MEGLKLYFPETNRTITMNYIHSFQFHCNMFSIYNTANVIINDMARETYNEIKMGMEVIVTLISEKGNEYPNKMRILSFRKTPSSPKGIGDILDLDLISSWYFNNMIGSQGHKGNVGGIINSIVNYFRNDFSSISIEGTSDIERVRYQTYERTQDFMVRILKYANVNNFPVYLFTNAKGELKLKSIYSMLQASPKVVIAPEVTGEVAQMPSNDNDKVRLPVGSFKFSSNGSDSTSTTYTEFTTEHFKTTQKQMKVSALSNPERSNAQSSIPTPEKYVIKNWELSPDDALSISIKENFESNIEAFTLGIAMSSFIFNNLDIGNNIKVNLPFEPIYSKRGGKTNLGEGNYIVYKISYLYSNQKANTTAKLFQATFK